MEVPVPRQSQYSERVVDDYIPMPASACSGFQDGRELYDGATETILIIRDKECKRHDQTRVFTIDAELGVTRGMIYKAVCARIREAQPQRVDLSWNRVPGVLGDHDATAPFDFLRKPSSEQSCRKSTIPHVVTPILLKATAAGRFSELSSPPISGQRFTWTSCTKH